MMKTMAAATLTVAFMMSGGAAAYAKTEACPDVTEKQVEGLFTKFNDAWATKDPAKVTSLFTSHPVLLATVSNEPRTTPAAVNDYFVSFLKGSPVGRIDTSTIEIDCQTASRVGTWTVTLKDAATNAKTEVKARYSFLYRYEGNEWKIDHLHSSMMPQK